MLTLILTTILTLIFIPLLRFDLCVMLTFKSELDWFGQKSKHGLCGADVVLLAGLTGLPVYWQKSRYNALPGGTTALTKAQRSTERRHVQTTIQSNLNISYTPSIAH
jgi:hypothetical protein